MCDGFLLPSSFPAFVVISFLHDSPSDWGEMKSQHSFILHFPDGQGC
jgi:hypothetical protein